MIEADVCPAICKWAFFPSTSVFQSLAPILASKREQRTGQGIYSLPWLEPNMGPPSLPLFLSPSLPPSFFSWQWKKMPQNRQGVGGKGEKGGKVDRAKKKKREQRVWGKLLDQEWEKDGHLCCKRWQNLCFLQKKMTRETRGVEDRIKSGILLRTGDTFVSVRRMGAQGRGGWCRVYRILCSPVTF